MWEVGEKLQSHGPSSQDGDYQRRSRGKETWTRRKEKVTRVVREGVRTAEKTRG